MITNIHVHTPYSFSAFRSISELVETAAAEEVTVLGINDLNTSEGFREFSNSCREQNIFPVFNIEFAVVNDTPADHLHEEKEIASCSTGKLSGKALPYPYPFPGDIHNLIASIWKDSQDRIWKMIELLNEQLELRSIPVRLEYNAIRSAFAKSSVYEQHIALALYNALVACEKGPDSISAMLCHLFDDKDYDVSTKKSEQIRQDIIYNLLSSGKKAYVPMSDYNTLTFAQARNIILQAGGIPCYQCRFNSCSNTETDPSHLAKKLIQRGIFAIEFIPQTATMAQLRKFMTYFSNEQFCVSVGTCHGTSITRSTIPVTKEGIQIDQDLLDIGFNGACIFAAHQEHHTRKKPGFIDELGNRIVTMEKFYAFVDFGRQEIKKTLQRN